MKKIKYLFLVFFILLLVGCGRNKKYEICTIESNQEAMGYTINTSYDVYVMRDVVTKVYQTDVVKSDKKEILDFYKKEFESMYKKYNDAYGGYSYDINIKGNNLTSKITIDYTKLDRNKFIKDNAGLKKYVNKNKYYTVDGITKMYMNLGAVCKKYKK